MARWRVGEVEIQALLSGGELQRLSGDAANGELLLAKASTTLASARSVIDSDPDSAFVLAYDASRQALTALLAHQGLRPTTKGGHYAVERAVRAQFGSGFRQFGALRRRRDFARQDAAPGFHVLNGSFGRSHTRARDDGGELTLDTSWRYGCASCQGATSHQS